MQGVTREYAWASNLSTGECCPQNCAYSVDATDKVPSVLLKQLPFGHGVRVVNLGPRPRLLQLLQTDAIRDVQHALKEAMPENCPSDTMVHLGLRNKLDQRPFQEHKSDVLLSVYTHSPATAAIATKSINRENYVKTQRDEVFTMQDLMNLGVLKKCELDSETYRMHLVDLMATALNSVAPAEDSTTGRSPIMDTCQTTVHTMEDGKLVIGLGMNVGVYGAVWHTPAVGMTLFFPSGSDNTLNVIPASNGRTIMYCAPPGDQETDVSSPEGVDAMCATGFPVANAMLMAHQEERVQGIGSIVASHAPGHNEYTHVNLYESTYTQRSKLDIFQLTSGRKQAVSSASLLTIVPGIQNVSGVLYGHVKCNDLHQLLKYTDPESDSVLVPNEPKWRDQLIDLDDSGASYHLMRPDNAVANCMNKVAGHRLPKSQIAQLLKDKNMVA